MTKFRKKFKMKKLIYFFSIVLVSLIIFFTNFFLYAQEYSTDRLFIKKYNKAKCLRSVEERVNSLKKKRVMTLEHELLLNNNIWYKIRTKLPLSHGEMERLRDLKENGFDSKNFNSKKIWAKKEKEFKVMRSKCK